MLALADVAGDIRSPETGYIKELGLGECRKEKPLYATDGRLDIPPVGNDSLEQLSAA